MTASIWNPGTYPAIDLSQAIDPRSKGAVGDGVTDDTAAFQAALADSPFIYISPGDYLLGVVNLPANAYIFGAGPGLVTLRQAPSPQASKGILFANSGSPTAFLDNIVLRDFTLVGRALLDPFVEFFHTISLNGVRRARISNLRVTAFSGDGIYLGSGDIGGQERHNFDVVIENCYFDGVNYENRNAVSIIDGDGVWVRNNTFYRCSKSTMPGAVDIEPDQTWHVTKNIFVVNNKFKQVGGNVGVVSCVMAGTMPAPENIVVEGNSFEDNTAVTSHADIAMFTNRVLNDASDSNQIVIANNVGRGGCKPLDIRAVKGVTISGNRFEDYTSNSLLGYISSTDTLKDAVLRDNYFRRVGEGSGSNYGVAVFNVDSLTLENNTFDDCGDGAAGSCSIDFAQGTSVRVKLRNNVYRAPSGRTLQATVKEAAHTFTALTNTQLNDLFLDNLGNNFQALESNNGWQSYTPVVAGATSAGSCTYGVQEGFWRREGNLIHFLINVSCSLHTGTGTIRASLPAVAAPRTGNPLIPVGQIYTSGWNPALAANEQVVANLNDQAIVNGVQGCVQLAKVALGNATAATIAGSSMVFSIRGMYEARIDVMT